MERVKSPDKNGILTSWTHTKTKPNFQHPLGPTLSLYTVVNIKHNFFGKLESYIANCAANDAVSNIAYPIHHR